MFRDFDFESAIFSCAEARLVFVVHADGYYRAPIFVFFLQFKEFELCWGAVLTCVHTFFNDFDLSKRDTGKSQRALSFIRGLKRSLVVLQVLRVVQLLGWPYFKV